MFLDPAVRQMCVFVTYLMLLTVCLAGSRNEV